jgi:hypothetical protein
MGVLSHPPVLPVAHHIGGGVGVEVAGAALGLAAADLVEVAERLAMVGDQCQVNGQPLEVRAQRLGRVPGQRGIELLLQLGVAGQGRQQGLARRLVGRGVAEALALLSASLARRSRNQKV